MCIQYVYIFKLELPCASQQYTNPPNRKQASTRAKFFMVYGSLIRSWLRILTRIIRRVRVAMRIKSK